MNLQCIQREADPLGPPEAKGRRDKWPFTHWPAHERRLPVFPMSPSYDAPFSSAGRPERSASTRPLWHQRASRDAVRRQFHGRSHRRHHAGHLRLSARTGHRRPAVHRARTRTPSRAPAQRDGARGAGGERRRDDHPARRWLHADACDFARDPRLQPRPQRPSWPTASSSRPRTIRRRTAASSTTRRTADRPTPTSPLDPGSGQRIARARQRGVKRMPARAALTAPTTHAAGFRRALRRRPRPTSSTSTRSERAASAIGVDPLGGASLRVLAADRRALRSEHHRRQHGDRSDVRVHDAGSRRQDPDGLLEPVRDGEAGRAEGSLSTSRSATIPTPTGTASSRRRPG